MTVGTSGLTEVRESQEEMKGQDVAQWLEGLPGMHEAWALSLAEKKGEGSRREGKEKRKEVGGRRR